MANSEDFRGLAKKRLKTAEILMNNEEWGMAAYMLGFVLECILKASACKVLNLSSYPETSVTRNSKITNYFLTHDFDQLLIISGASDIFRLSELGASSWSGFTQEYTKLGQWTDIRYNTLTQFDQKTVENLHKFLTNEPNGIIPLLEKRHLWKKSL